MTMTIFKAARQHQIRPADETFTTIEDAYQAALGYYNTAHEKPDVHPATLRAESVGEDVMLVGKGGKPAKLTFHAFGQLAQRSAIADVTDPDGEKRVSGLSYLRSLPPDIAAANINYGLRARYNEDSPERFNLLIHANGDLVIRAITSEKYARIWNWELLHQMRDFHLYGWGNPVPFKPESGNEPHPTIYVSDKDMFVFQCNEKNRIVVPGKPDGLSRGFFVENCEIGQHKFKVTTFLFDYMCCNHMIWGAQNVTEIDIKHIGSARERMAAAMQQFQIEVNRWSNSSTSDDVKKIAAARSKLIESSKEKVIEWVFNKLRTAVSKKTIEASYELAERNITQDGDPRTAWGLASGMTRYSQTLPYADARVAVDRAAARIVEMAF